MQSKSAYLEPSVGGSLGSREQIVVAWVESRSKGTVDDPAADMNSEIDFQDIIVLEENLLGSRIGRPVSSYIDQSQPSRECHTGFESVSGLKTMVVGQCANAILDLLGKLGQGNAGLCDRLHMVADLAMDFGSFAIVLSEFIVQVVHDREVTKFFGRGAPQLVMIANVIDNFTLGTWPVVKQIVECNSWWSGLLSSQNSLLLLVLVLPLFLLAFSVQC